MSIGRMDRARTLKLDLKRLSRPDAGHLFEITAEPPGGSPTGRPTGPILMKGLASQAL
jgi:anti-sigma-K factor RskA